MCIVKITDNLVNKLNFFEIQLFQKKTMTILKKGLSLLYGSLI